MLFFLLVLPKRKNKNRSTFLRINRLLRLWRRELRQIWTSLNRIDQPQMPAMNDKSKTTNRSLRSSTQLRRKSKKRNKQKDSRNSKKMSSSKRGSKRSRKDSRKCRSKNSERNQSKRGHQEQSRPIRREEEKVEGIKREIPQRTAIEAVEIQEREGRKRERREIEG